MLKILFYNLEILINLTYGQMGHRRNLFLTAHYYNLKNLKMVEAKKLEKIDYDEFEIVPLPISFHNHIKNNQITNPRVIKFETILNMYKKLL